MRARSICSLTPAVRRDYRNINRPGLTESLLQPSHCQTTESHSSLSDGQKTEVDADICQWTMEGKVISEKSTTTNAVQNKLLCGMMDFI